MTLLENFTTVSSLYLHFPFCRSLCNYCDFHRSMLGPTSMDQFEEYMNESLKEHFELFNSNQFRFSELETIYIGGGTPFLWGERGITFLRNFFNAIDIKLHKDCEFTLELNPGTFSENLLKKWCDFGVNRFSVGVQSFDDNFLQLLGRSHRSTEVESTLKVLDAIGVNFSVDLMLGLPLSVENKRDVFNELNYILKYDPDHLSVYILTPKDNYCHVDLLPDDDFLHNEYLQVSDYLKKHSYDHYEVSNFAKKGKESRHNLKYWNEQSVAAFGPSATGLLIDGTSTAVRYKWFEDRPLYSTEQLDKKSIKLEMLYLKLRTNVGLNLESFFSKTDLKIVEKVVKSWQKRDYIDSINPVKLSALGFIMLDFLMDELFIAVPDI